jgi:branched-chain amino acid aminotransferase
LFGPEGYVTEAGSSNFFVIWRTERGNLQMVTAALDEHTILAGVTRQSILELAKERFSYSSKFGEEFESLEVVETKFTIFDIISAAKDGRLLAAFAVGTACFIVPISHIRYKYEQIDINVNSIPHVSALQKWMSDILYGNEPSAWTDVIQEE